MTNSVRTGQTVLIDHANLIMPSLGDTAVVVTVDDMTSQYTGEQYAQLRFPDGTENAFPVSSLTVIEPCCASFVDGWHLTSCPSMQDDVVWPAEDVDVRAVYEVKRGGNVVLTYRSTPFADMFNVSTRDGRDIGHVQIIQGGWQAYRWLADEDEWVGSASTAAEAAALLEDYAPISGDLGPMIEEARGWLADCGNPWANEMPVWRVLSTIKLTYSGGLDEFALNTAVLAS